jgi:hypothetical protein
VYGRERVSAIKQYDCPKHFSKSPEVEDEPLYIVDSLVLLQSVADSGRLAVTLMEQGSPFFNLRSRELCALTAVTAYDLPALYGRKMVGS